MLFTLNSVLGGTETLLLCLHDEGEAHLKLAEGRDHEHSEGDHSHAAKVAEDCDVQESDCNDIMLNTLEFAPMSGERFGVEAPREWILPDHLFVDPKRDLHASIFRTAAEARDGFHMLQTVVAVEVMPSVELRL
ncbi:hypothetical protein [Puniceicoccus vermicola]|uniref:Uncharacterized protein n=1 Tax=Puniceicoccus vermicola TaxID=388746 RepID=A0A7X1B140_9BACT|nr:hypothetical protein [Puniceicoccus vermicola]MBC2603685.1 hypothetical protein [Puniceicoccus vermicola]